MKTQGSWSQIHETQTGVVLATVERIDGAGVPWVRLPDLRTAAALFTTSVTTADLKRAAEMDIPVVVAIPINGDGDEGQPIILGVLGSANGTVAESSPELEARVDGQTVRLTGQEEVTLRCGKASITLTKAGKIILRGAYVLSRSSGVNRIKGASVQIN